MTKRIITLCYRKIIDSTSALPWEKMVFEDSYNEFRMQAQLFNPEKKYKTFSELIHNNEGAQQLHFLVSGAIIGYIKQLNEIIPDILNNLRKHFLRFSKFHFEIINSDIQDKSKHQVAINFYSGPLIWHETIGNYILISDAQTEGEVMTSLIPMQPFLNINTLDVKE